MSNKWLQFVYIKVETSSGEDAFQSRLSSQRPQQLARTFIATLSGAAIAFLNTTSELIFELLKAVLNEY